MLVTIFGIYHNTICNDNKRKVHNTKPEILSRNCCKVNCTQTCIHVGAVDTEPEAQEPKTNTSGTAFKALGLYIVLLLVVDTTGAPKIIATNVAEFSKKYAQEASAATKYTAQYLIQKFNEQKDKWFNQQGPLDLEYADISFPDGHGTMYNSDLQRWEETNVYYPHILSKNNMMNNQPILNSYDDKSWTGTYYTNNNYDVLATNPHKKYVKTVNTSNKYTPYDCNTNYPCPPSAVNTSNKYTQYDCNTNYPCLPSVKYFR
jgi:hypothetical protein